MNAKSNVFQFIDLPRVDPQKTTLAERKSTFNEIYQIFTDPQAGAQADRCIACGIPYCQNKCPIHNNIPDWLKLAYEERFFEAADLAHTTNSLPEVCGRVCPQERLCEGDCTLNAEFGAVTIGAIERYLTERAFELGWRPEVAPKKADCKKVAVIGAGPAGLACADYLNRNGVKVTVFEREPEIGGLLTFGIPSFKLEKEVMSRRREFFQELGIEFKLNVEVGRDIELKELTAHYDALFLGVGTYQGLTAGIPGEDAAGVYSALPFLIDNTKKLMGLAPSRYVSMKDKRVVVLGGGDTAMDCLRTSIRQGAQSVTCVYRRDEANMPGSRKEYHNAREEGVNFTFNAQPVAIEVGSHNEVTGIQIVKTKMGEADASGRRRAEIIPGSEETLPCDAVIVAFGFAPHSMPWLRALQVKTDAKGRIALPTARAQQTTNAKIFAGGDITHGSDLVVTAIADGRAAAFSILDYLDD